MIGAGPGGPGEAARGFAFTSRKALGGILDLLKRGASDVTQMLEPDARPLFARLKRRGRRL